MGPDFEKAINEIRLQMRRLVAIQQNSPNLEGLTERDIIILETLNQQRTMTVSQITRLSRTQVKALHLQLLQNSGVIENSYLKRETI